MIGGNSEFETVCNFVYEIVQRLVHEIVQTFYKIIHNFVHEIVHNFVKLLKTLMTYIDYLHLVMYFENCNQNGRSQHVLFLHSLIFTAHIQRIGEGNIFSLFT